MARGGGGGNDWEGTWVPMVAPAELAGTRGCSCGDVLGIAWPLFS